MRSNFAQRNVLKTRRKKDTTGEGYTALQVRDRSKIYKLKRFQEQMS